MRVLNVRMIDGGYIGNNRQDRHPHINNSRTHLYPHINR